MNVDDEARDFLKEWEIDLGSFVDNAAIERALASLLDGAYQDGVSWGESNNECNCY